MPPTFPFNDFTTANQMLNQAKDEAARWKQLYEQATERISQYQRTNGSLMVAIDRLNIRIAELKKGD